MTTARRSLPRAARRPAAATLASLASAATGGVQRSVRARRMRRHPAAPGTVAVLLLAGCAPYLRTDTPVPRPLGVVDALASLVTRCDEPRPGDPQADAPESVPGDERRERRRCTTPEDRADGAPTPGSQGPTHRKP